MASIYDQHQAAFSQVAAYVVMLNNERVATIAFKFPRDGAGRLYAYAHWLGAPMVRGFASGGGYDKKSAACASAARKITPPDGGAATAFRDALADDNGFHWDQRLRAAGFTVLQAV